MPVDGNVGLRYVRTESDAHGYTVFTPPGSLPTGTVTGIPIPPISAFAVQQDFKNTYNDFLPSLDSLRSRRRRTTCSSGSRSPGP